MIRTAISLGRNQRVVSNGQAFSWSVILSDLLFVDVTSLFPAAAKIFLAPGLNRGLKKWLDFQWKMSLTAIFCQQTPKVMFIFNNVIHLFSLLKTKLSRQYFKTFEDDFTSKIDLW